MSIEVFSASVNPGVPGVTGHTGRHADIHGDPRGNAEPPVQEVSTKIPSDSGGSACCHPIGDHFMATGLKTITPIAGQSSDSKVIFLTESVDTSPKRKLLGLTAVSE